MEIGTIARYLAPLILVAMLVTTVVVISTSVGGEKEDKSSQVATPEERRKRERRRARARQTTYTVKQDDTLEVIATKTKVSSEDLIRFNPEVDPQALQPGQELNLK